MGFTTSGSYSSKFTSYQYYGITFMIYSIFLSATIASNSFMEERIKNGNMRILYSPVPARFLYISKIIASFMYCSICHLLCLLVLSKIVNVNYGGSKCIYTVILVLLAELVASSLGILMCIIVKKEQESNQIISIILMIFSLLGGVFFPIDRFGKAVTVLSNISPIKWMAKGMFNSIFENSLADFKIAAIFLSVLAVLMLTICHIKFKEEEYLC